MKLLGWLSLSCLLLSACQADDLDDLPSAQAEERGESELAVVEGEGAEESVAGSSGEQAELAWVDGDRLWSNLESLVGQRYWAKERAITRQMITESLVASGWEVEEQAFDRGVNLVATYPSGRDGGEEPRQKILVGAHYDTVQGSPGADDNATGVAVLLELAALYKAQLEAGNLANAQAPNLPSAEQNIPERELVLVFFDQEENGLLGSLAFTAEPENLELIHSAVVLDMLGASCGEPGCQKYPEFLDQIVEGQQLSDVGDFIAVVGEAERPGLLSAFGTRAAGESAAASSVDLPDVLRVPVPFKGLLTPDVLRSDHAPFWLNGIGAVLVTDTANLRNPHYHQPSDDLDQVDRLFFEGVAQQVVDGVWRLLWVN